MRNGGTTPASLLLHGPPSVGKQRLALWFGQLLLCAVKDTAEPCGRCENCRFSLQLAHPDLHWFFPRPRLKDTNPSSDEIKQDLAAAAAARRDSALLYPPTSGADGIFVAAVRALVKEASLTPAMGRHKVFIVGEAERIRPRTRS
jgi:DNA polymerase-3 subunit delta'